MAQSEVQTTPQCILCEVYPVTASVYARHLYNVHKSTLIANGIYLICACGLEVRSARYGLNHIKQCDGNEFTLHKLNKITTAIHKGNNKTTAILKSSSTITPQCILCNVYPVSAHAYAVHLQNVHKSTLIKNGLYALCACGFKVTSKAYIPEHAKCGGHQFTLHKLDENTPVLRGRRSTRQQAVIVKIEEISDGEEEEGVNEEGDEENGAMGVDEGDRMDMDEDEDKSDGEEEEEEDHTEYKLGGYHSVSIGDIFNGKYQVTGKLGWGRMSTVWRCKEANKNRSVALRIAKSADRFTKAAKNEIELLRCVGDTSHPHRDKVVKLLESFSLSGANGDHECMVFEIFECNLFKLSRFKCSGMEIDKVKIIIRKVLEGLDYLHIKCNIIHTDIKPENIMVTMKKGAIMQVKIGNLSNACWTYRHFSDSIQTKEYRSPEVFLGVEYDTGVDIWSSACMTFELATGDYLFKADGPDNTSDADQLGKITQLLGQFPAEVYQTGTEWNHFYNREGKLMYVKMMKSCSLMETLLKKYEWNLADASLFSDLLLRMLDLRPTNRSSAAECLQHDWLQPREKTAAAAACTEEEEDDDKPGPSGINNYYRVMKEEEEEEE